MLVFFRSPPLFLFPSPTSTPLLLHLGRRSVRRESHSLPRSLSVQSPRPCICVCVRVCVCVGKLLQYTSRFNLILETVETKHSAET